MTKCPDKTLPDTQEVTVSVSQDNQVDKINHYIKLK